MLVVINAHKNQEPTLWFVLKIRGDKINNNVYLVENDGNETIWSTEEIYGYLNKA